MSMNPVLSLALALTCSVPLSAQTQQEKSEIEKKLPIPSRVFTPPPPKEAPPIKVEAATTRRLPTHQITVLRGDASTLPDIPPPPEPKSSVQRPVGQPSYLLFFAATVYDHRVSHVKWHDPRTKESFEAWCEWDWTLLSPIPDIKLGERVGSFHLLTSNIDTGAGLRFGKKFDIPEHPELVEGAFSITKGNENDPEALEALIALRDYYFQHKERLILIQKAKEEYKAAATAWHAANPPKPENHTFWLKPHRGSRYLKEERSDR